MKTETETTGVEKPLDERLLAIDFSEAKYLQDNYEKISEHTLKLWYSIVMEDGRHFVFEVYVDCCNAKEFEIEGFADNTFLVVIPMATLVVEGGDVLMARITETTARHVIGCVHRWKQRLSEQCC